MNRTNSTVSSSNHSSQLDPTQNTEFSSSSSKRTSSQLNSSLLRTAAALSLSPTTTERTSLLFSSPKFENKLSSPSSIPDPTHLLLPSPRRNQRNFQSSCENRSSSRSSSSSNNNSILFSPQESYPDLAHQGTDPSSDRDRNSDRRREEQGEGEEDQQDQDRMSSANFSFTPSNHLSNPQNFDSVSHEQSIEHLLSSLGYSSSNPTQKSSHIPSTSRAPLLMHDIDGETFSMHEHSLSPVSERTELETSSSKTSHSKKRSLAQSVLAHQFQLESGIQSTAPLKVSSPNQKHLSVPSSDHQSPPPSSSPKPIHCLEGSDPASQHTQPASFATYPSKSTRTNFLQSPHLLSLANNAYRPRPSIHRIPKKTSQLIQLFENTSSPSPSNVPKPSSPQRPPRTSAHITPSNNIQYSPNSILSVNPSSPAASPKAYHLPLPPVRTRTTSPQEALRSLSQPSTQDAPPPSILHSSALQSAQSWDSVAIPEPTMTEQECLIARQERRERIAMATKNNVVYSTLRPPAHSQPSGLEPPSPMSDQHLKHRKSVASSITSKISDVHVLHSGLIWYRNPQTRQWKETRGILTPEAVYLMNENGRVDQNLPDQSIELNLCGCISVESVRSKRSYGPDFAEPHLHILRIAWAEFNPQSNSRSEYEEFLGCSRATQRADWVGAIWQAAHDLGGFVDQPDIPLRRDVSPISVQPSPIQNKLTLADSNHSNAAPSSPSVQASSPRLEPISLVDRAVSIDQVQPRQTSPMATAPAPSPQSKDSPSQLEAPEASLVSSRTSHSGSITTNMQSELDRELYDVQQTVNPPVLASKRHLYSEETLKEIDHVDLALRSYPIDPNLQRRLTRPPSPELDIFAMLDRMSISGSIHRNTAQFYDPPPSQEPQPPQPIRNSQPDGVMGHTDSSILDQDPDFRGRSLSQNSYHTIRPTSAAGIHDQHVDSPRSSALGLRSIDTEYLSEVVPTTKPDGSQIPGPRMMSFPKSPLPACPSSPTTPKGPYNRGLLEPHTVGGMARGAWSDTDRLSNQTDNILVGSNPARAVQRDLRRILKTIERNDSHRVTQSESIGNNLDSIQNQLQNVAAKLRGHPLERESDYPANEKDEPTIADKVDYMLSLCNILLESQHKVSSAVQKNLRAHGVSINNRSAHTRSAKSSINPSRRSSQVTAEPGMPGPAPLTPLSENNVDVDQSSSPAQHESPPLPPLPDPVECEESSPNAQDSSPSEALPPVAVQEAGLSRIENLLVALLSRMDESAQRQQPEPPQPPPVPEKDATDDHLAHSGQSCIGTESQIGSLDLDADVALWKSRGTGGSLSDKVGGTWNDQQPNRSGQSVTSHPPSVYPPTEPETLSTPPDHFNRAVIPDYNLAYEAEDEVARRIADERARAARRLEGVSTPFKHRYSFSQNGFPAQPRSRVASQSHEPTAQMIPPNQDHHDSHRSSTLGAAGLHSVSAPPQPSYWSSATSTNEDQDSTIPPPPPPKDNRIGSQAFSQPAPSTRPPSRAVSSSAVSHLSASQSHLSDAQSRQSSTAKSVSNAPPLQTPQSQNLTEEIRNVVQEVLQLHSTEQAPVLDEVVALLRTQDQVSQASVLNQGEVSRYLSQLNVHLEGVLHQKNEDIHQIGDNVGRLEKQIAYLVEQSEKIYSTIPLMNTATSAPPPPPPDQAPTCIDQPQEEVTNDVDGNDTRQINPDDGLVYPPVDVSVHPQDLDPTTEGEEPHVTLMSNKPSMAYKMNGPRARKISFGKMGLKGPRMPTGLSSVGKLWGGPTPVADRSARWGAPSIGGGGGGSLKRVPTKSSRFGGESEHLSHVEGALSQVNPDYPVAQEALSQMDAVDDDRSGTIALGVSHILKFLRENAEKEELRRKKKEEEKANTPQPAIPDEMEKRRAKIEELQLRREATLAEDKAKHLEAMIQAMKQQAIEHDKLLKKIAEEMENKKVNNHQQQEEERRKNYQDALEGVNKVLTTVESGVLSHLEDFKTQMLNEMKQTFEKVGELREQKQQIQADIADMLAYMSKVKGGAPDPRWQHPPHIPPPSFKGGTGHEGSIAGHNYPQHLAPIPESYPVPHTDFLDRDALSDVHVARSVSGFGPRPPGPR